MIYTLFLMEELSLKLGPDFPYRDRSTASLLCVSKAICAEAVLVLYNGRTVTLKKSEILSVIHPLIVSALKKVTISGGLMDRVMRDSSLLRQIDHSMPSLRSLTLSSGHFKTPEGFSILSVLRGFIAALPTGDGDVVGDMILDFYAGSTYIWEEDGIHEPNHRAPAPQKIVGNYVSLFSRLETLKFKAYITTKEAEAICRDVANTTWAFKIVRLHEDDWVGEWWWWDRIVWRLVRRDKQNSATG